MALKHTNPSDLPKHKSPDDNHRAIAPYNFAPLPDEIMCAVPNAEALPDHDTYAHPGYPHTGYFEVTLTTLTPTYIRGMLTEQEFRWQEEGKYLDGEDLPKDGNPDFRRLVKNKPDFFMVQEKPVIPGSSLRGMLRQLVEIVTYSKMKWVTDKKLFYRTMDNSVIGDSYRQRMMEKVEAGFLHRQGDSYTIQTCRMVRIHRNQLSNHLYDGSGPMQTPKWHGQHHQHLPVWVTLTQSEKFVEQISLQKQSGHEWHEGRLVITGNIPRKKKEFVFLLPNEGAVEIPISEKLAERFQDDDQITQWQQKSFPANQPHKDSRRRNGALMTKPGAYEEPVFFLRENGELTFFGRAQMFRLPYQKRPLDLIPDDLRDPAVIDFAEAMFGFIRTNEEMKELKIRKIEPKQGSKGYAYASRIFVTDAHYNEERGDPWLSVNTPDGILEPPILATPKPTAFQHYLTQQNPNNKRELQHYDSSNTTLRGFKLYWAQGQKTAEDLRAKSPEEDSHVPEQAKDMFVLEDGRWRVKSTSTQHTRMKPVADGKTFTFRIHFENLSDVELGALQWVLTKPQCHRLGMGKPLGMGVVKLQVDLYLTPRVRRYTSLLADWDSKPAKSEQDFSSQFENSMAGEEKQFQEIERVKMLLKMLEWTESDAHTDDKQYITQLDVFRERFVLPNPRDIGTLSGSGSPRSSGQRPSGGPGHSKQQGGHRDNQGGRQQKSGHQQAQYKPSPGHQSRQHTPKPNRPQQTVDDSLPEVRDEVSDFAKSFAQRLQEQGSPKGEQRKKNKKKKR